MSKYDCTKAKDFLHELKRASEWCRKRSARECKECEMTRRNKGCFLWFARNLDSISERQFDYVIEGIQKWSDSHPERRELTEDEMHILKAFKTMGFKYIEADADGSIYAYDGIIRKKNDRAWHIAYEGGVGINICLAFKFFKGILSFDDEEPAEIEELLKGYE